MCKIKKTFKNLEVNIVMKPSSVVDGSPVVSGFICETDDNYVYIKPGETKDVLGIKRENIEMIFTGVVENVSDIETPRGAKVQ